MKFCAKRNVKQKKKDRGIMWFLLVLTNWFTFDNARNSLYVSNSKFY